MQSMFVAVTIGSVVLASTTVTRASVTEASTATSDDRETPRTQESDEHLRVGVIGGLGFPRPIALEAMIKIERVLALGVEYSFLPNMNVGDVGVRFHAISADMRVFPLASPFYAGLRFGRQHLSGATTVDAGQYGTFTESVSMDTWFLNPRIGVLWTASFGLSLGIEAGVQIPLSHTLTNTLPSYVPTPASVTRVTDTFGASVLPTVSLLQAGMLF